MLLQDTYLDVKTSILVLHRQGKGGDKGVQFESMCNLKKPFFPTGFYCVFINVFAEEYKTRCDSAQVERCLIGWFFINVRIKIVFGFRMRDYFIFKISEVLFFFNWNYLFWFVFFFLYLKVVNINHESSILCCINTNADFFPHNFLFKFLLNMCLYI